MDFTKKMQKLTATASMKQLSGNGRKLIWLSGTAYRVPLTARQWQRSAWSRVATNRRDDRG